MPYVEKVDLFVNWWLTQSANSLETKRHTRNAIFGCFKIYLKSIFLKTCKKRIGILFYYKYILSAAQSNSLNRYSEKKDMCKIGNKQGARTEIYKNN